MTRSDGGKSSPGGTIELPEGLAAPSSLLDPHAVADATVNYLRDITSATAVVLYRWDESQNVLVPFATAGVEAPAALPVGHPGQGIAGNAYLRKASVLVDDYTHSDSFTTWGQDYQVSCGFAVPMIVGRRTVGVLAIYYTQPVTIDPTRQRMVALVAQHAAPTLDVMRLLGEARRSAAESITLAKLIHDGAVDADPERACARITEVASRLLGSDFAVIGECDAEGTVHWRGVYGARRSNWESESYAGSDWPLAPLISAAKTVAITDLRTDHALAGLMHARRESVHTIVLAPLGDLAGAAGVLMLGWRIDVVVTQHQRTLAETLAIHATTIVRHARELKRTIDSAGDASRESHYRALCEHAADLMLVLDTNLIVQYASPSHATMLGIAPADVVGRSVLAFLTPEDAAAVRARCPGSSGVKGPMQCNLRVPHRDGSLRDLDVRFTYRDGDPADAGWLVNARDATAHEAERAVLTHQATHDLLTRLPNRAHFGEQLRHALLDANASGHTVSLLLLDLNRFQEINDAFGHEFGDHVLQEVGERLRHLLRRGQSIARFGGDEFAIVLPQVGERLAQSIIEDALRALDEPFKIDGHEVTVTASFGVALYPDDGLDGATLLRHAGAAMHLAKKSRRGYVFYDHTADPHSPARLAVINALRTTIATSALRVEYQPKLHLATQEIRDAEALARWPRAPVGYTHADEFIPLAEHTGMITALTEVVLESAFVQWHRWKRTFTPPGLAINISMESFREAKLPALIFAAIEKHGIAYRDVCLELTESALMTDPDRAYAVVHEIAERGVRFSIDDFGTGYSSLAYLKRFDVVELKIDKLFVSNMLENPDDHAIVRWIIELGHSLGLEVVAEGVENDATLAALGELGCDMVQGFAYARPMAGDDYERWNAGR
jgi:diguanylate cyclase (GGDEF)-like protein/PAS domain S-box-containing protein